MSQTTNRYATNSNLGSAATRYEENSQGASSELIKYFKTAMFPCDLLELKYDPQSVFTELVGRVKDSSFGSDDYAREFILHWLIWAGRELAHHEAPPARVLESARILIASDPNNTQGQSYGQLFLNVFLGECIRGVGLTQTEAAQKRSQLAALVQYEGVTG